MKFKSLLLFFLLPVYIAGATPDYISVDEGLSNRYVTGILQDHAGLIWVGTTNGLNMYDGYTFRNYYTYSTDLRLSNSRINGLIEDAAGNLWIATDRGLNRISADRSANLIIESLKNKNISSLFLLSENSILLGSTDGEIIKLDIPSLKIETLHHEEREAAVIGLSPDKEGNIWYYTNAEKKVRKLSKAFAPISEFELEPTSSNFIIAEEMIFAGKKDKGFGMYSALTGKQLPSAFLKSVADKYNSITLVHKDKNDRFWLAGPRGVVLRIDLKQETIEDYSHLFRRKYFGSDIKSFFEDDNGMMWVGTDGGIVKVSTPTLPFQSYLSNADTSRSGNFISTRGMIEDKNGDIYIGTYSGLFQIDPVGTVSRHLFQNGDIPAPFQMIHHGDHQILMTTVTNGLVSYNTATRQFSSAVVSLSKTDNQLYALYKDSDNTIWVGSRSRGVKLYDEASKQLLPYPDFSKNPVLSQSFVLTIVEFPKNTLWMGTNKGLVRIDKTNHTVKQYTLQSEPALTNEEILCITPDNEGGLWLGSRGGGLMKLDPAKESIDYFNTTEGLSSNIIYGIIPDGKYLWLSTENGISQFDPKPGQFRNYYAKDGLNNNEFNTASHLKTSDGRIFFGGVDGVNSFLPSELTEKMFKGRIVLTSVRRSESEFQDAQENYRISLPYDDRNLSVEFALTDYYRPQGNSFYYRIEGLDKDWVSLGSQNFLRISQMPPGQYRLLLKGKNINDQESSNQIALSLTVEQIFYKRAWFIFVVIVLSISLVYFFFRMRLDQLINMQRLRTKIASDLHDEVGSMLTRISILTEVLKYKNKDQEEIGQIASVSRQATATMSDVLWSVDARNDKIGNLVDRLREHADSLLLPLRITIHFDARVNENQVLQMQVRQNLLLIFKEAIHNIAKHAEATEVWIGLAIDRNSFSMTIRDNGTKSEIQGNQGQGMRNMKMRAAEIGAELEIVNNNQGMEIVLKKGL